jgi:hypothetical protein
LSAPAHDRKRAILSKVNEPCRSPAPHTDGKGEQRIIVVIKGRGATSNCIPRQASDGGTTEGLASGSATTSGPSGSAADGQSARAGGAAAKDKSGKEGWRARKRKREMIVDLSIVVSAFATVIGTIVAVCAWTGWTP